MLGEVAYPQGHGKIERFNQYVKKAVLRHYDRQPGVDPDCRALELRLGHWITNVYNQEPHESLDRSTPWERFSQDERSLNLPQSEQHLREHFVVHHGRSLSNDHIACLDGLDYELPSDVKSRKVDLRRNVLDGSVSFLHKGQRLILQPVDLESNARSRRALRPRKKTSDKTSHPLPKSAADLAFEADLGPITDDLGGFVDSSEDPDQEPSS